MLGCSHISKSVTVRPPTTRRCERISRLIASSGWKPPRNSSKSASFSLFSFSSSSCRGNVIGTHPVLRSRSCFHDGEASGAVGGGSSGASRRSPAFSALIVSGATISRAASSAGMRPVTSRSASPKMPSQNVSSTRSGVASMKSRSASQSKREPRPGSSTMTPARLRIDARRGNLKRSASMTSASSSSEATTPAAPSGVSTTVASSTRSSPHAFMAAQNSSWLRAASVCAASAARSWRIAASRTGLAAAAPAASIGETVTRLDLAVSITSSATIVTGVKTELAASVMSVPPRSSRGGGRPPAPPCRRDSAARGARSPSRRRW